MCIQTLLVFFLSLCITILLSHACGVLCFIVWLCVIDFQNRQIHSCIWVNRDSCTRRHRHRHRYTHTNTQIPYFVIKWNTQVQNHQEYIYITKRTWEGMRKTQRKSDKKTFYSFLLMCFSFCVLWWSESEEECQEESKENGKNERNDQKRPRYNMHMHTPK